MKKILLLFSIMTGTVFLKSQVGIGTASPNLKSILDISSTIKGVLLPRINTQGMNNMNLTMVENGMLVMNSQAKKIDFWNGKKWKVFKTLKNAVFTLDCSTVKNQSFLSANYPASGYIEVTLNVTEPGNVNLLTNSQNSVRFIGARNVNTGNEIFWLEAVGTPSASGNVNFTIASGGTTCTIPLTIN